jgi:nitroreductase
VLRRSRFQRFRYGIREATMTLEEAVRGRRSIRKFRRDPIPEEILREILDQARWAPSWGNTQPWEFVVLAGDALEEYRTTKHRKMMVAGDAFSPEIPMPEVWPESLKKRYMETGKIVLTAMGLAREDKEGRNRLYENMALLFDAPCLVVACIHGDSALEYAMLDIGLILQTLCLSAYDKGIGSCIMAVSIGYPALLRKIAAIGDDRRIVMGVALGYPDPDYPLNRFERVRADIGEFVRWVS